MPSALCPKGKTHLRGLQRRRICWGRDPGSWRRSQIRARRRRDTHGA